MAGVWEAGVPGGGYYRGHGLHGALGVVKNNEYCYAENK